MNGMQVNIRSRYGIRNFAVPGRDYEFINGDETDFRSANIRIINSYHGVQKKEQGARTFYETRIHVRGDILVGRYRDEITAAIAYNKAADMLRKKGVKKDFPENYIESLRSEEYHRIYDGIRITGRMSI